MKHVKVEYIESGTFQGSEEDVSRAGIKYGEDCIVISKATFIELSGLRKRLKKAAKWVIQNNKIAGRDPARSTTLALIEGREPMKK